MNRSENNNNASTMRLYIYNYILHLLKIYVSFKMLIRRPLAVLYNDIYLCYSFYCNLLQILSIFIKRKLILANNNALIQIDMSEYSPIILRDLLITLNSIGNQILSSESRSVNLSINIYVDAKNVELGDIFTCCQMNPFVRDINIVLADRAQAENNAIVHRPTNDEKIATLNIKVSSDGEDLQLQGKNYFKAIHRNCLRVPRLSTRVWASNILKTFKPASFIVCFHAPESDMGIGLSNYTEWRLFFMRVWEAMPCVHFLLLNYSLDWGKEFAVDLPNVTPAKMFGYNLSEEFALVQSADMYMGSFDKYAAIVTGSEKPFLLFGLNETDRNTLTELMDSSSQLLSERQNQLLIAEDISLDCLFDYFRRFYMDLSARYTI